MYILRTVPHYRLHIKIQEKSGAGGGNRFVGGEGSTVTWTQVFQEFDTRPGRCPEGCDAEMSAEYVVEMLLFRSVIFAFSHHTQAEQSLVEP